MPTDKSPSSVLALLAVALLASGCAGHKPTVDAPKPPVVHPVTPLHIEQTDSSAARPYFIFCDNHGCGDVAAADQWRRKVLAPDRQPFEGKPLFFDFDSAALTSAATTMLDQQAMLINLTSVPVIVEGNCDERGTREYNQALGQRRADAVKSALVTHGADGERIEAVSYGEERPVCTQSNPACWRQNRRVDIRAGQ